MKKIRLYINYSVHVFTFFSQIAIRLRSYITCHIASLTFSLYQISCIMHQTLVSVAQVDLYSSSLLEGRSFAPKRGLQVLSDTSERPTYIVCTFNQLLVTSLSYGCFPMPIYLVEFLFNYFCELFNVCGLSLYSFLCKLTSLICLHVPVIYHSVNTQFYLP